MSNYVYSKIEAAKWVLKTDADISVVLSGDGVEVLQKFKSTIYSVLLQNIEMIHELRQALDDAAGILRNNEELEAKEIK